MVEDTERWSIRRLDRDTDVVDINCGDDPWGRSVTDFIVNDALDQQEWLMSKTTLFYYNDNLTGYATLTASVLELSPNPPMDRDGWREDSGRGEGVTGAMIRARIRVDGRLAGGLQALLGAPMAAYSGCGERDGGIGHGKRRSRTGLARVCGDVGLAGGSVADGRRQAGSGMARSRARARLNCSSQGQRRGRCRVNRRAERVIRPARAKTRRLRVLVVTIC